MPSDGAWGVLTFPLFFFKVQVYSIIGKSDRSMKNTTNERRYTGFIGWFIATSWLAYWQLRQSWRMLLFMGIITLSTIVIVCAIPLFSTIALTASLRDTFDTQTHPFSNILRIGGDTTTPTMSQLANSGNDITSALQQAVNIPFTAPDVTISTWNYAVYLSNPALNTVSPLTIHIASAPDALLREHLVLTKGVLPAQQADGSLELVIPAATASAWHVSDGSTVFVEIPSERMSVSGKPQLIPARIVGIGEPKQDDILFGYDNASADTPAAAPNYTVYGNFAAIFALTKQETVQTTLNSDGLFSYYWTFAIDTRQLQLDQIDTLVNQGNTLALLLQNSAANYGNLTGAYINENGFFATAGVLQANIVTFQTPTNILIIEILSFIIFFISVLGKYIVAWQSDVIITLRSRGMEQGQIIGAFSLQLLLLSCLMLIGGPILAVILTQHIAHIFLFQSNIAISSQNIIGQAWSVAGYAVITAGAIILAAILAIARAAHMNILSARRESARETRAPLWQKMYLDVGLGVLGVAGFIAYYQVGQNLGEYVIHTNQYLTLFSILAPLMLAAAGALLFFRVFPLLLRIVAWIAGNYRGALPIIAFARLARTPQYAAQTATLLAFSISIATFTIVTTATQQQRVTDIATYTAGADFRGVLPSTAPISLNAITNQYRTLPGVENAAAGASFNVIYASSDTGIMLTLQAMDGNTFAQTAYWGNAESATSLAALMQQISAQRAQAAQTDTVPAIVDAATWDALGLTAGAPFTLSLPGYTNNAMKFTAIAKVSHLPAIFDTAGLYNQNNTVDGGILVDYQTFQAVYAHDVPGNILRPNTVWLRTQQSSQILSQIRAQLNTGSLKLGQLQDRAALIARYQQDPLQKDLLFAQIVAAIAACILAFIGLAVAAGFNVTQQKAAIIILHALGAGKRQLQIVAVWEQLLIYGIGLLLGIFLSAILIWLITPMLAFVQLINSNGTNSSLALDVPPVHMIIPAEILAIAIGVIFVLSLGAAITIIGQAMREPFNQTLRLNQD